jgi:hypothetical protein
MQNGIFPDATMQLLVCGGFALFVTVVVVLLLLLRGEGNATTSKHTHAPSATLPPGYTYESFHVPGATPITSTQEANRRELETAARVYLLAGNEGAPQIQITQRPDAFRLDPGEATINIELHAGRKLNAGE